MVDREKVIKALGCWCDSDSKPDDCPCELRFGEHPCDWNVAKAALELLKQEPVKPKTISRHGEYPEIVHRCGACNSVLLIYYNKYCPMCGRQVKWDG